MKKRWGHDELATDLANKFRADSGLIVWENMQMGASGSQRPDVYVLQKSYTRFCPVTYECKVSVSDFRSDITAGKWQGYLAFSSAVVFAAPAGLISKDEVPNGCGLILRHDDVWRMAKKPTMQHLDDLPRHVWMKLLIDGIERQAHDRVKMRPGANTYRTEMSLREKHGAEVATLVAQALRSREGVQHAIEADEKRRREIKAGTDDWARRQQEMAKIEAARLTQDQVDLATALGLPADATARQLRQAIYAAASRLGGDDEVRRLRMRLERAREALDQGLEPLPVATEALKGVAPCSPPC